MLGGKLALVCVRAAASLSDISLQDSDYLSMMEEPMLIHNNADCTQWQHNHSIWHNSTPSRIDSLERSSPWRIAGTLDSCPQLFSQLIVIQAQFNSSDSTESNIWAFPCTCVLLASKDQKTYESMIYISVTQGIFSPDHIMVDFELGLRNALGGAFPGTKIDGCYFNFCPSLMRHV